MWTYEYSCNNNALKPKYIFLTFYKEISLFADQHNVRNTPDSLLGYSIDVCNFMQVNIACPPNYVVTEMTTESNSQGYCGCFRFDTSGMARFLNARCFGTVSCRAFDRELKSYDIYMNHPPGNCGYERKIRYRCEPGITSSFRENPNNNYD